MNVIVQYWATRDMLFFLKDKCDIYTTTIEPKQKIIFN